MKSRRSNSILNHSKRIYFLQARSMYGYAKAEPWSDRVSGNRKSGPFPACPHLEARRPNPPLGASPSERAPGGRVKSETPDTQCLRRHQRRNGATAPEPPRAREVSLQAEAKLWEPGLSLPWRLPDFKLVWHSAFHTELRNPDTAQNAAPAEKPSKKI